LKVPTIILFLTSITCYGQEELRFDGFGTTFIVEGSIGAKLMSAKCPCSIPKKSRCTLYEFKVSSILYFFENQVFSHEELEKVNYVVIVNDKRLDKGKEYVMSLRPATSKYFVQLTDTLGIDPNKDYKIKHSDGYISGLFDCPTDKFTSYLKNK
jgi:hypothetical protein